MQIASNDVTTPVTPGTTPDYGSGNPLHRLMHLVERVGYSAELEYYLLDETQYLFSVRSFEFYGPSGGDAGILDPKQQLNKEDFQKQNVKDFATGPLFLARGWVSDGNWSAPYLRVSYDGGPDSPLSRANGGSLGPEVQLWIKVQGNQTPELLTVPYNEATDRYEVELWGYTEATPVQNVVDEKGLQALERGEILIRPDLIRGRRADFAREGLDNRTMWDVAPEHCMHPLRPLRVECAWTNAKTTVWDNNGGSNYRMEFNQLLRGWDSYLGTGFSSNPHGGVGGLQFLNLFSNYFGHKARPELGRTLEAWNLDAQGQTGKPGFSERFLAVDYLDLHLLHPNSGIGLHRHRDNQEIFLILKGQGFMVTGDWCITPQRERCLEVRKLREGSMTLLKPGGLHGLMNTTDERMELFMFGGYD